MMHSNLLLERFLNQPMVVLLNIRGNCSTFGSKVAHLVGHLPEASQGKEAVM
jgi:hypothetical protein